MLYLMHLHLIVHEPEIRISLKNIWGDNSVSLYYFARSLSSRKGTLVNVILLMGPEMFDTPDLQFPMCYLFHTFYHETQHFNKK